MENITRRLRTRGRSFFVVAVAMVCVSIVAVNAAGTSGGYADEPVSVAGLQYGKVLFKTTNESLSNAFIQTVAPTTPNAVLNKDITDFTTSRVVQFKAGLPSTPAVAGFFHQLRIVPHVNYVSPGALSMTIEVDEYHPSSLVQSSYVTWLADDQTVQQVQLTADMATKLSAILSVKETDLQAHVGETIALALLPNFKARLYKSAAMNPFISGQSTYIDVPLAALRTLLMQYKTAFYPSFPAIVDTTLQRKVDKSYQAALARQPVKPADCAQESCVALTFDDGPNPQVTPRVAETLHSFKILATFFEQGNQVLQHFELTKQLAASGHEIENHSFNHPDFVKLKTPALIRKQIDDTQGALASVGVSASFLRPPYGSVDDNVRKIANMPLILWNVDSQEWRPEMSAEAMAQSVEQQTRPSAIILMHDTNSKTADALPGIVTNLQQRGFRFVTVKQLLQIDGSARGEFAGH